LRDIVKDTDNNNIYICTTAHTSSGSVPISTNTDVAKWSLLVDAASATTSAAAAATSATAAASSATAAASSSTTATAKAVLTASDATDTAADLVLTNADVVSAEAAKVAAEGATGALAFKFTFDNSTTMADPGTGELRLNNGTVASVTAIAFDAVSADTSNPDVSDYIASWDDGSNTAHEGYITIRKSGTPATYAVFSLTGAVTDSTGYLTAVVTHVDSNGSWTNGDTMYVSFARSGDKGATGSTGSTGSTGATGATGASSSGFHYQFETATADSDQGAGKIWLNHATVASATILYIDDDDNDGTDISAFTATWDDSSATSDKGFIKIQSRATATDYAVFKINSSGTDNTAYWEFPVTHLVSAGTFSDTEVVDVFFTRSGDSGGVANRTVDTMTGDGSDTTLALSQSPGSSNNCTCFIDGVGQHPGTDFNIAGSTLTFTTAPPNLSVVVAICGGNENIGTPSDGTVTLAKMDANSIDSDQYVDGSIDTAHIATNQIDESLMKDAFVADFTEVTVATGDSILLGDATDSGNTKRDTVQGILDLVPAAGADTDLSNLSATGLNRACQAWVQFDGSSVSVADSGGTTGVSSLTDRGVGLYTVTFTSTMANATYTVGGSASVESTVDNFLTALVVDNYTTTTGVVTTSAVAIATVRNGNNLTDSTYISVMIFGD